MNQHTEIDELFRIAIQNKVGLELELLDLKREIYETLAWADAAGNTARAMIEKGHRVPNFYYNVAAPTDTEIVEFINRVVTAGVSLPHAIGRASIYFAVLDTEIIEAAYHRGLEN